MTLHNLGTQVGLVEGTTAGTTVVAFPAQVVSASVTNANIIDLNKFEGDILFIVTAASSTSGVITITLNESDASNMASDSAVSGVSVVSVAGSATKDVFRINSNERKRYCRVIVTESTAGYDAAVAVVAVGSHKYGLPVQP